MTMRLTVLLRRDRQQVTCQQAPRFLRKEGPLTPAPAGTSKPKEFSTTERPSPSANHSQVTSRTLRHGRLTTRPPTPAVEVLA